ncbi:MAG TPA: 3-phosphoshikimate 1-carboxyvinyltransferase [Candidatus Latescibacteria bacterium]|nr:3-phosphoshikimate 1-carboxyvinyltransferase [Candidatus Latescibacterota bacterium]
MKTHARPITPVSSLHATIRPPGSKSLTNRALLCAALAYGESEISNALVSDDSRYMISALRKLGVDLSVSADGTMIRVRGCSGRFPAKKADLFVGNAGTAMRFLTAALTLGTGVYTVDGDERMRQRPILDLVYGLRALGADVLACNDPFPPVLIRAEGLDGGSCEIDGTTSSQFVSAVLMAAPYARRDTVVTVKNGLVSAPYVGMTRHVMRAFGADVEETEPHVYHVAANSRYFGTTFAVEPDASAGSYFFAAAAITGGTIRVTGIGKNSVQGDRAFVRLLEAMGCVVREGADWTEVTGKPLHGISADMADISDTAMTLAVVALFADSPTSIRGIGNVRVKESDRIAAIATEARKLGAQVEEFEDGLRITPAPLRGAMIETYNDHRIAMSFAIAGLRQPGVVISNPECVNKTYPGFFEELTKLGG